MTVRNLQKERDEAAIPSNVTPLQLSRAMQQLDLSGVPPHKRPMAIAEHLHRIMEETGRPK